jgi:hypothetical protein
MFSQIAGAIERATKKSDLNPLDSEIWKAHDAGHLTAAEHDELVELLNKKRLTLPNRHERRREKVFGAGRPRPLAKHVKTRLTMWVKAKMRKIEKGKHYGAVTAKIFAVFEALLWKFHNEKTGLCFPGYEAIAAAAGCTRSTVPVAIKALDDIGILSWVNRLKRVWEEDGGLDLFGRPAKRQRVVRTSNGYWFNDPPPPENTVKPANSSKSDFPTPTTNQALVLSSVKAAKPEFDPQSRLGEVFKAWGDAYAAKKSCA